jgi:hypothetical protein
MRAICRTRIIQDAQLAILPKNGMRLSQRRTRAKRIIFNGTMVELAGAPLCAASPICSGTTGRALASSIRARSARIFVSMTGLFDWNIRYQNRFRDVSMPYCKLEEQCWRLASQHHDTYIKGSSGLPSACRPGMLALMFSLNGECL